MNTELLFLGTGAADWAEIPSDDVKFDTDKKRGIAIIINVVVTLIGCLFAFEFLQ